MRLFIAMEIPEHIKQQIAQIQDQLKKAGADASWTRSEGIHLTLKFLGEAAESKVPDILKCLQQAAGGAASFQLSVAGVGAFPHLKNPRVLWIGLIGEREKLMLLQASVEKEMETIGFAPEERTFSPHLTLARIKFPKPRFSWQQVVEPVRNRALGEFSVNAISLMKSELNRTGAVYTEMGRVELK